MASISPINQYSRELLEKDKFLLADVRYMTDENLIKKTDWARDTSSEDEEGENQGRHQILPRTLTRQENNPAEMSFTGKLNKEPLLRRYNTLNAMPLLNQTSTASLLRKASSAKYLVTDAEVLTLQSILEAEDSHAKQWKKHLLAVLAVAANLLVNWLRGDSSPLEINKCGYQSWTIFGLFCIFMLALSFYGVRIN